MNFLHFQNTFVYPGFYSVVRVAQSLDFCVVFCVIYPVFFSVVRAAQSSVFCVVFCVV